MTTRYKLPDQLGGDVATKRFWAKVDRSVEAGCWPWLGYRDRKGYGKVSISRRIYPAHRLSLAMALGRPVDPELVVDHLCRNPPCVNPKHLEEVTTGDNTRRGVAPVLNRARHAAKTHCANGHPYPVPAPRRTDGYRRCPDCASEAYLRRFPGRSRRAWGSAKLDDRAVAEIRSLAAAGLNSVVIAKRYGVNRSTALRAINGTSWAAREVQP